MENEYLATFVVRHLALRDIVTRLLASHALTLPDPNAFLEAFSEQGTLRATTLPQSDHQAMKMGEAIQDEYDSVIVGARALVTEREE